MAFDWIKSFAISPAVSGTASTVDALDYHSCVELYFNYAERGWKLIPLTIGMGRLNEAVSNFAASDDALHASDPLVYMNANMMLSSALGTQLPLPEITAADIHRGSYTTEQIHEACLIGHDLIKELANLSETAAFVPDSDLHISIDALPEVPIGQPYSHQLTASGGTGGYTWELISSVGLPNGLALSSSGVISGMITEGSGSINVAFKVTDEAGAFQKVGLTLKTALPVGDITSSVEIFALANTNYGIDAVATLVSEVQTAPDGLANFRVAIAVDPMEGTSITSQAGGLWGINSGEGASGWWSTFDGSLAESVNSVSSIQIVDFNPNGGNLTIDDFSALSFQAVTVRNGANARDRVKVVANGVANASGGMRMPSDPATIDLQALAGASVVSSFTLENGNIGNSSDRWNIEGIQVNYTITMPSSDAYASWVSSFGLSGEDASLSSDAIDGDGYTNLLEFALGMDPTLADAHTRDSNSVEKVGGSMVFVFQYFRREDYLEEGLNYTLNTTPDLVNPSMGLPMDVIVGDPVDGFEPVTTRYLMDDDAMFIWLQVTKD